MKEIPLTMGKVALVDDSDYEALSKFKWHVSKVITRKGRIIWYAKRCFHGTTILMHQQITGIHHADHKNRDGLDNQRSNLRPSNYSLNQANSIGKNRLSFRGIRKRRGKYAAQLTAFGKQYHLGTFETPEAAARAYDAAALNSFGEFATLNFPLKGQNATDKIEQ